MVEYVEPFGNGTEYESWKEQNCYKCGLWGYCYARRTIERESLFGGHITKSLAEKVFGDDNTCNMFTNIKRTRTKKNKIDNRQELLFKGEKDD